MHIHITDQNSDQRITWSCTWSKSKVNHACLTTGPVNVHNRMLALVFAVVSADLGMMFLRSTVSFVQLCILLGVEEMHREVT